MDKQKSDNFKFTYALSVATQLGFMTVASIGGFLALGMWLDSKLGSSPWLLIIGVITGIAVTVYEVHHLLRPLIDERDDLL